MAEAGNNQAYWQANVKLIYRCLAIWFVSAYVFSILLVDALNMIPLFGYKLGFWFAQQGSIYIFVALIFYYNAAIGKIEEKFGVKED